MDDVQGCHDLTGWVAGHDDIAAGCDFNIVVMGKETKESVKQVAFPLLYESIFQIGIH